MVVFTAISQSFAENEEHCRVIEMYFPTMDQLIKSIASSQPPATDSLLASAISLVGDLISAFGPRIAPFVESESVNSIIARLRRSRHTKAKTAVNWVARLMRKNQK